jgi:hypothetical protein
VSVSQENKKLQIKVIYPELFIMQFCRKKYTGTEKENPNIEESLALITAKQHFS